MDINKSISTPIVIGLIIVVSAVGGVAIWQLTKSAEQPTPKQAGDYTTQSACEEAGYYWYESACHKKQPETVDSGIYTNEEYNFELSFPEIWEGYKVREESSVSSPGVKKVIRFYAPNSPVKISDETSNSAFTINIYERDWWDNNAGGYLEERLLAKRKNYVMCWSQAQDLVPGLSGEQYDKISKIKKSFKVTKPERDWKTYTNEEYGFEFKYPQDWTVSPYPNGKGLRIKKENCHLNIQEISQEDYQHKDELISQGCSLEESTINDSLSIKINCPTKWGFTRYYTRNDGDYFKLEHRDDINSLRAGQPVPSSYLSNCQSYFDKILSTFRFTE